MTTKSGRSLVMSKRTLPHCFRLRHGALRRKHFYCLRRTFLLHVCCFSFFQSISLDLKPAESTTLLSNSMKCNVDIRMISYISVLLPSGTTMFQEIGERMTVKPMELPPSTTKIKVVAPPERQYSVRIGGSLLSFFLWQMWISMASTMNLARPSF